MTTNKVSRVLGAAFLLQFITSFFLSGVLLKPLWLVPGDIGATMLKIAENPAVLQANIFVDMLTALGVIFLGAMLFLPYVPFEFVIGIWILVKGVPQNQS